MLKSDINYWWKKSKEISTWMFALSTTILSFTSWEDIGITSVCSKVFALVSIFVVSLFLAWAYVCFKETYIVWSKSASRLSIKYGDLMKTAFEKSFFSCRPKKRCMVVIPVNTYFDTIVDENPAAVAVPIVSSNSLHGMWLKKMQAQGEGNTSGDIERVIFSYLDGLGAEYTDVERNRGSRRCYPIGTCGLVGGQDNVDFVLLALTEFDEHNRAHCDKERLIEAIKKMLKFIDGHCQGYDCYLPLMGTKLARTGLSHKEVLQTMVSVMELYSEDIHCKMNVVIYNGDKDKVSIFDGKYSE